MREDLREEVDMGQSVGGRDVDVKVTQGDSKSVQSDQTEDIASHSAPLPVAVPALPGAHNSVDSEREYAQDEVEHGCNEERPVQCSHCRKVDPPVVGDVRRHFRSDLDRTHRHNRDTPRDGPTLFSWHENF